MDDEQLYTLAELQAFLDGTEAVEFAVAASARYDFIARTVRRFGYGRLKRADKGDHQFDLGRLADRHLG